MLRRVHIPTQTADDTPIHPALLGLSRESLLDLSWVDPALGLSEYAWWPVEEQPLDYNLNTQRIEGYSYHVDPAARKVVATPQIIPLSDEVIQSHLVAKQAALIPSIDTERTARIAAGMPYAFPDGTDGTVQLRHERDILNVNAVGTAAMMMISAGDTSTKLDFRDQEDVTHQLTAPEMLAMAQDVMGWISAHYAAAWAHKDALKELVEAGDVEGVAEYDITQGWPT